jgi:hypothetical protein
MGIWATILLRPFGIHSFIRELMATAAAAATATAAAAALQLYGTQREMATYYQLVLEYRHQIQSVKQQKDKSC